MELFFQLFYTNTCIAIFVAFLIAFSIIKLIELATKKEISLGFIIFITAVIYFSAYISPLPNSMNRDLIKLLTQLEYNKVDSNAMINEILFACEDKQLNGIRGFQYEYVIDAYHRDLDNYFKSGKGGFKVSTDKATEQWLKNDDLCQATHYFNNIKFNRLIKNSQVTE